MTGGPGGAITFNGHDMLGSVTARFFFQGELTPDHPYHYTGKTMDPTTRISDYGFRNYAPELVRFDALGATAPQFPFRTGR